jgi:hypothetical protein
MIDRDKIAEARRLIIEATKERQQKIKDEFDNQLCKCGHRHKDHAHSLNINYSAGFCSIENCKCENFLIAKT